MTLPIRRPDLVDSVARALQHISHTHPADFLAHLAEAHAREASPAARNAMTQILLNSRMAATDRRPICQDTGIVNVLLEVGMDARWSGFDDGLEDAVNEGVRLAYRHPDNPLRASVVSDPLFGRPNTRDNTPAVIHARVVPGDTLTVTVAAKGGGSGEQGPAGHAEPGRQRGRLGAAHGARAGRGLVPARHPGHRRGRHRREGHAAGQGKPDGTAGHAVAAHCAAGRPQADAGTGPARRAA